LHYPAAKEGTVSNAEAAKYVLDQLQKTLADERDLAHWVIGLTITFAVAVLMGKRKAVKSFPSGESIGLALVLLLFLTAYWQNLDRSRKQARVWYELAASWTTPSESRMKDLLVSNLEMQQLDRSYRLRLAAPSFTLALLWVYLADIDERVKPLLRRLYIAITRRRGSAGRGRGGP
jgi:hypothetical protein